MSIFKKMLTKIPSESLFLRQKWIIALGGLPAPNVKNTEWLYMLEEEARNSLMIEGYFVSKAQLQNALLQNSKRKKTTPEILGFFEAARFAYEFAFQQFQENEFRITKSSIRALHALLFSAVDDFPYEKGNFRMGNIIITGAGFESPDFTRIPELIDKILWMTHKNKKWTPWRRAAFLHAFFENLHPLSDGNGRVGRILSNWVLFAHGFPNISIKGKEKDIYIAALEKVDPVIKEIFAGKLPWTKFPVNVLSDLENIFCDRLVAIFDYLIATRWEKSNKKLLSLSEIAKITNKNLNTLKVAASRKQIIAFQKSGKWFSHPDFLTSPKI
jgi:fido (protein-threonine AMPylation protein)